MSSHSSALKLEVEDRHDCHGSDRGKRSVHSQLAVLGGLFFGIVFTLAVGFGAMPLLKEAASSRRNQTFVNEANRRHVWMPDGFAALGTKNKSSTSSSISTSSLLPTLMKLLAPPASPAGSSSGGGMLSMLTGGSGSVSLITTALKVMGKAAALKKRIISTNTSTECTDQLDQLLNRLIQSGGKDSWALKFFDAMGKPPSGLLDGNPWWYGSRDECAEMEPSTDSKGRNRFAGRYCLANIGPSQPDVKVEPYHPSLPVGLNWAFCMPRSCSQTDFVSFVSNVLNELPNAVKLSDRDDTAVNWSYCEKTDEEWKLDSSAYAVLIVMGVFVGFAMLGTLLEWLLENRKALNSGLYAADSSTERKNEERSYSRFTQVLLAFSCIENGRKILTTTSANASPAQQQTILHSLHGIRVLTMAWIILIHTWLFSAYLYSNVFRGLQNISEFFPFQIIFNGHLAVDTFFVLSGTLLVYLFLHESDKRRKSISWFQYYFFRFWRLTPAMMVSIGILAGIMPLLIAGPNSYLNETFAPQRCVNSWWTNLLYVNNFFHFDQQCAPWTWYLACDTQFYVLAPLVLVPLVRRGTRAGVTVLGGLLALHMLTAFVSTMARDVPMEIFGNYLLQDYDQMWKFSQWYYTKPWGRSGPYIVGMLLGVVLYKLRLNRKDVSSTPFTVPGWCVASGWLATIAFMLVPLFFTYPMYQNKEPYPTWVNALYNTFARTFWALGISWIIFACETGYGAFINAFLSWEAFVPLSKLTYCAFLLHVPLISFYTASSMSTGPFSYTLIQWRFCGILLFTYVASFAFSLVFEAPMVGLAKAMLGGNKESKNKIRPHSTVPSNAGDEKAEIEC